LKYKKKIIKKFKLGDKIKVIENDIRNEKEILSTSDIIIIYNSYEWFTQTQDLKDIWEYTLTSIKSGAYIITTPSIQTSLKDGDITEFSYKDYLELIDSNEENEIFFYQKK